MKLLRPFKGHHGLAEAALKGIMHINTTVIKAADF